MDLAVRLSLVLEIVAPREGDTTHLREGGREGGGGGGGKEEDKQHHEMRLPLAHTYDL